MARCCALLRGPLQRSFFVTTSYVAQHETRTLGAFAYTLHSSFHLILIFAMLHVEKNLGGGGGKYGMSVRAQVCVCISFS